MLRALTFVFLGWFLVAAVAGLGQALSLTVMLPAASAAAITHLACAELPRNLREFDLPIDLGLAMLLGYLADLHEGFPAGTLCLAHGVTYLGVRWAAGRLSLEGLFSRAVVTALATLAIDLIAWVALTSVLAAAGVGQESLTRSLWVLHWHALATLLAAPTIWWLFDTAYRLGDRLAIIANRGGPRPDRPGPVTTRNRRPGPKRSFPRPSPVKLPHDRTPQS